LAAQLVGQLEDVAEEPSDAEADTDDAAAADASLAATPAGTAAVSAAVIAAAAVTGCDSDSGGSSRSDGSAVPVRSMPVPITQRKVRFGGAAVGISCVVVQVNCEQCLVRVASSQRACGHHIPQGEIDRVR
jgi:starvation-inducible outer membrane lipoprotein